MKSKTIKTKEEKQGQPDQHKKGSIWYQLALSLSQNREKSFAFQRVNMEWFFYQHKSLNQNGIWQSGKWIITTFTMVVFTLLTSV